MIVSGLLTLIKGFLSLLLNPISIPMLPDGVETTIDQGLDYISDGLGIFAAFTHYSYLLSLFMIVLVIEAAMLVYKFVRWLLQKIPMLGIK